MARCLPSLEIRVLRHYHRPTTTCSDNGHSTIESTYIHISITTMTVKTGLDECVTPTSQPYHISCQGTAEGNTITRTVRRRQIQWP